MDDLGEDVSSQNEEVGGKRVSLMQSLSNFDVSARGSIDQDGGSTGNKRGLNPLTPSLTKATCTEGAKKEVPFK